jgi:hypothetical protein
MDGSIAIGSFKIIRIENDKQIEVPNNFDRNIMQTAHRRT